jgi:crotonobetainyl-CoA:carnitine CoA-transferase CaiB-like acyl-CoA transferase
MAPNGVLETAAGAIQIVIIRDHDFVKFCKVIGREDMATDDRFRTADGRRENAEELYRIVREILATQPATQWRDGFTEAGLQNEVVQNYDDFISHPHVEATGLISWMTPPGSEEPWAVPNVPGLPKLDPASEAHVSPRLGQHSREILAELGYAANDIDTFAADGVIGV